MTNPISNITIIASILSGITNIFLSFLIFNYILAVLYTVGVYQVIYTFTKNHHSAAFGGILSLSSGLILTNGYTNTHLLLIYNIPWICYGFLNYFKSFDFKFLAIFVLALIASIYSYEVVYTLSFLFLILLSTLTFYRNYFSKETLKRIPKGHIWFFWGAMLIGATPMALIVFKAFGGSYLPPGTRFDVTTSMIAQEVLSLNVKASFKMINKFFFTCENCLTAMFTGAFWGDFIVGKHYIGALAFPFLTVALLIRTKVAYCISLLIFLTALLAGNIFPVNLLYQLPLIHLIKYGAIFNWYLNPLIIVLAALGYNLFFNCQFSFRKEWIIWSSTLLIIGCAVLWIVLPPSLMSGPGILISSIASLILIIFVYHCDAGSFDKLAHFILLITLATGVTYHYSYLKTYPHLMGVVYKDSEFTHLLNRQNHALKFAMERPDSLLISKHVIHPYGPSALSNEYFSFIGLRENTYQAPIGDKGMESFPILKNHIIFRSLPGSESLLKKKFFFFDRVFLSEDSNYFSQFANKPELLRLMIENNIGVADFPADSEHPAYSGPLNFDKINFSKQVPLAKILSLEVTKFNANSIILTVTTNKPGLLLYTDTWDEGWHAKVNGNSAPVVKVFKTYKGVELNAGKYEVEFYFSNSVLNSMIIFNVAYFILLVFVTVNFTLSRLRNSSELINT